MKNVKPAHNNRIQTDPKKPARFCAKIEGSGRLFGSADPGRWAIGNKNVSAIGKSLNENLS